MGMNTLLYIMRFGLRAVDHMIAEPMFHSQGRFSAQTLPRCLCGLQEAEQRLKNEPVNVSIAEQRWVPWRVHSQEQGFAERHSSRPAERRLF